MGMNYTIICDILDDCGGIDNLRNWVRRDSIDHVAYIMWDDCFCGVYSEDDLADAIRFILSN